MAQNLELRQKLNGTFDGSDKLIYITSDWNYIVNKPTGGYTPAPHDHDASEIVTGLLGASRMGTSTPGTSTFLSGDRQWRNVTFNDLGGTATEGQIPNLSPDKIIEDTTHRFVTDSEKGSWNGVVNDFDYHTQIFGNGGHIPALGTAGHFLRHDGTFGLPNYTVNTWRGIVDNLTSTSASTSLSANQGRVLKGLIDTINTLLLSDNSNLDTLQEIVDYIETNKATLDTLGISNITGLQNALDNKFNKSGGILTGKLTIDELGIDGTNEEGFILHFTHSTSGPRIQGKYTQIDRYLNLSADDINLLGNVKINGVSPVLTPYSHPTHPGDDFNIDTGTLSGSQVVSRVDINVTTDTYGHVTDANGAETVRNLDAVRGTHGSDVKFWSGTQTAYNNISVKDASTFYFIVE